MVKGAYGCDDRGEGLDYREQECVVIFFIACLVVALVAIVIAVVYCDASLVRIHRSSTAMTLLARQSPLDCSACV